LSLGLAGSRWGLSVERVAINVRDYPSPDNEGAQPCDEPITLDGPAAYFSTLPFREIVAAWHAAGIPGYVSNSAGAYLCNEIMYLALHRSQDAGFRAGFIHLPYLPEQVVAEKVEQPSMSLDLMVRGIELALQTCVRSQSADLVAPTV
jgi:pyroglutamyl-peptidase